MSNGRLLRRAACGLYSVSLGVLFCGIVFGPDSYPLLHFVRTGFVSTFSAALLLTASLISAANAVLASTERSRSARRDHLVGFWQFASAGLLLVTLDEVLDLHGGINFYVTRELLGLERSPLLARTDALVVATYGAVAAAAIARNRAALRRIPQLGPFLLAGGGFALASVAIDLAVADAAPGMFVEDGAKVLAGASLVLACFAALATSYVRIITPPSAGSRRREKAQERMPSRARAGPGATEVLSGLVARGASGATQGRYEPRE